jgi:hypothetical protein
MVQLKRHARGTGLREAIRRGRAAADCATRRWVHGTVLRMYGCTGLRPGRVPVIPNVLPFQAVGERGSTGRQALTRQSERRVPLRIGETGSGGSNVNGLVVGSRTAGAFTPGGGPPLSNFHRTLLQAVIGNTQGQSESLGLSAIRRPGEAARQNSRGGHPGGGPPLTNIRSVREGTVIQVPRATSDFRQLERELGGRQHAPSLRRGVVAEEIQGDHG